MHQNVETCDLNDFNNCHTLLDEYRIPRKDPAGRTFSLNARLIIYTTEMLGNLESLKSRIKNIETLSGIESDIDTTDGITVPLWQIKTKAKDVTFNTYLRAVNRDQAEERWAEEEQEPFPVEWDEEDIISIEMVSEN